jgi:hypothetical protein
MIHCSAQRESHWAIIEHEYSKSIAPSRDAVASMLFSE